MEEMMKYVLETYGNLIHEKEGKTEVYDEAIDWLGLSSQEKAFIRLTFKTYGINVVPKPKEKEITKEDRSTMVRDYNYGEVQSYGNEASDKPVIATLIYEGEQLVFEDYEDLDDFIINEFIPFNVKIKVHKSRNAKGVEFNAPYKSIQLNKIVKLRLSEKEFEHVTDVLRREGVRIGGTSQDLDSEIVNYDYIRTYAKKNYPQPLSREEERKKFDEYQKTKDSQIYEELFVRNLRLVPYVAWRIALRHGVEQEDLESYGYEALMTAIKRYDPNRDAKFSSYAIKCLSGAMKTAITKMKGIRSDYYYEFQKIRYVLEQEWGKKYDGDPEMLEEILDIMVARGTIIPEVKSDLRRLFGEPLSIEELKENDQEIVAEEIGNQIANMTFDNEVKERLWEALETLTPREQKVLQLRFGLLDGHQRTLEEVGKEIFVSRGRVRQIETKALRKLRHPARLGTYCDGYLEKNENDGLYVTNVSDEGDKHKK